MKSSMLKLLMGSLVASSIAFGGSLITEPSTLDDKITNFFLNAIETQNSPYRIKSISVRGHKDLDQIAGWKVYFVDIDLEIKKNKKDMMVYEKVFTNGKYIAKDFLTIDKKASLKRMISVDITDKSIYNKKHLIYGTGNEPHKIIAFSDPVCPFCQNFMPGFLQEVKSHPGKASVYYYHLPLERLHPASPTISRLMLAARAKGIKDVELKVYEGKDYFKYNETDEDKIIRAFNKVMGTSFTKADIHTKKIDDELKEDKKYINQLMISGTPTIYVDGKKDDTRELYKKALGI